MAPKADPTVAVGASSADTAAASSNPVAQGSSTAPAATDTSGPAASSVAAPSVAASPSTEASFSDNPTIESDPRSVASPGAPKLAKIIIVRRRGRADAPAIVTGVTSSGLVTAVVLRPDHPLETGKNLAEIHPDDKQLTGWYWPEG